MTSFLQKSGHSQELPAFVLAHLACGCTVMQRRCENEGLFYLLLKVPHRTVVLYCPEHRRQVVQRLITRTRKRDHWPLVEKMQCSFCRDEIDVPPPPAEGDEETMPNGYVKHSVRVRCPSCGRFGNYSFADSAESRYDLVWQTIACPNCQRRTIISYDAFTTPVNQPIPFKCMECRDPFSLVFRQLDCTRKDSNE